VPEKNDGPIKKVVLDNFNEIVRDENVDAFVWYSSQCIHCALALAFAAHIQIVVTASAGRL
jgi:hypothetical protein